MLTNIVVLEELLPQENMRKAAPEENPTQQLLPNNYD